MEKSTNSQEQHKKKTVKTAEDFTTKQYEYALNEFKNLQTGRIIRCATLYDTLDKNATQCDPSKKGKYKDCYFVVVKGPTYVGDECVSNAIVLKINSKQEKNYEYIFYKKDYQFLQNEKSYLSCRSIGLGPNDFKMLQRMKEPDNHKKDRYLNVSAMKIMSISLRKYERDERKNANEKQRELQNIKDDGTKETQQQIKKLQEEKKLFEDTADHAARNANLFDEFIRGQKWNDFKNNTTRERGRDRERENERPYDNNNNFRYNNGYRGRGRGGFNRGYQPRQPNNYGSQYNQNYRRGRGRGGRGGYGY